MGLEDTLNMVVGFGLYCGGMGAAFLNKYFNYFPDSNPDAMYVGAMMTATLGILWLGQDYGPNESQKENKRL